MLFYSTYFQFCKSGFPTFYVLLHGDQGTINGQIQWSVNLFKGNDGKGWIFFFFFLNIKLLKKVERGF